MKFHAGQVTVPMLNGERLSDVVSVDTDNGFIVRYVRRPDGGYIHDGDQFKTETVFGDVTVGWNYPENL